MGCARCVLHVEVNSLHSSLYCYYPLSTHAKSSGLIFSNTPFRRCLPLYFYSYVCFFFCGTRSICKNLSTHTDIVTHIYYSHQQLFKINISARSRHGMRPCSILLELQRSNSNISMCHCSIHKNKKVRLSDNQSINSLLDLPSNWMHPGSSFRIQVQDRNYV